MALWGLHVCNSLKMIALSLVNIFYGFLPFLQKKPENKNKNEFPVSLGGSQISDES